MKKQDQISMDLQNLLEKYVSDLPLFYTAALALTDTLEKVIPEFTELKNKLKR